MPPSRRQQRTLLCLGALACHPTSGGGFSSQSFFLTPQQPAAATTASPQQQRIAKKRAACNSSLSAAQHGSGGAGPATAVELSPQQRQNLRRPRARAKSRGIFSSVTRTPMPPGYEGEKKERRDNDDEGDFDLNVGKVIDALRRDYPRMFEEPLDFDIYTPDLQLQDPTGVILSGLPSYQRLFATFRFFRQVLVNDVSTVFRLSYDASRQQVRVIWHFVLDTRPVARPLHIDGISVYILNSKGLVRRHDIETIIVNGTPVKPPFAQISLPAWVSAGLPGGASAPGLTTWSGGGGAVAAVDAGRRISSSRYAVGASSYLHLNGQKEAPRFRAPFFASPPAAAWRWSALQLLQSAFLSSGAVRQSQATQFEMASAAVLRSPTQGSALGGHHSSNVGAFPAASDELGATREGSAEQGEGSSSRTEEREENDNDGAENNKKDEKKDNGKKISEKKKKKKKKGFWPIADGPWGCETSWDCTGGYVCCDLILIKICCSNGIMQPKEGDLIPVLLPIPGRGRTELDD